MPRKGSKNKRGGKVQQKLKTNTKGAGKPKVAPLPKKKPPKSPTTPVQDNVQSPVLPKEDLDSPNNQGTLKNKSQSLIPIEEGNVEVNKAVIDLTSTEGKTESDNVSDSDETIKPSTRVHHYNDSDGENSWTNVSTDDEQSFTQQDDENTVASNETSAIKKKYQNKIVLPNFIRYQMMIQLDQEGNDNLIDESKKDDKKSPVERVREFLISFTSQLKKFDSKAKVISWKTNPNFSYLNTDDFPTELAEAALYFQGYRANLKADKRIYMRVGIHTPNSQTKLHSLMKSWMTLHGYSYNKCIIQSETSTNIGWLVYSTQYTDTENLRRRLEHISGFE